MDIYKKNMQALEDYRYLLLDAINEDEPYEEELDIAIDNYPARDGNMYLLLSEGESQVRVNSSYSPVKEAEKWAQNCFETNSFNRIIAMYGFGNGYCVREVCKLIEKGCVFFIYEPFISVFDNVLHNYDISDLIKDERIYLYVGKKAFLSLKELYTSVVGFFNVKNVIDVTHPQYNNIIPRVYMEYLSRMSSYDSDLYSSVNTLESMGREFITNEIYSLKHFAGSNIVGDIKKMDYNKEAAIVVAAGPSLSKNVLELKKVKNKVFIFSTDTALKTLLKNDIIPDAMISIDSHKPMSNFLDDRCNDIPLFYTCISVVEMLKKHRGKKIYIDGGAFENNILAKANKVIEDMPKGGSVATAALMVGIELGFKNIILIGQDLAYGPDKTTHAGAVKESTGFNDRVNIVVDGIDGKDAITRLDWIGYLRFIEDMIPRYKDINIIDATEGGALIHGSIVKKLSEICEEYKDNEFNYEKVFSELEPSFSDADLKIINEEYMKVIDSLNDMEAIANEGIVNCRKVMECIDAGESYNKYMFEKGESANALDACYAAELVYSYIMPLVKEYVVDANKDMGDKSNTIKNNCEKYMKIFEKVVECIPEVRKLMLDDTE